MEPEEPGVLPWIWGHETLGTGTDLISMRVSRSSQLLLLIAPQDLPRPIDCCFSRNKFQHNACLYMWYTYKYIYIYVCFYGTYGWMHVYLCACVCVSLFEQITLIDSTVLDNLATWLCTHEWKTENIYTSWQNYLSTPISRKPLQQVQSPPLNRLSFPVVGTRWSRSRWFRDLFWGGAAMQTKMDQGAICNGNEKTFQTNGCFPCAT